MKNYSNLQKATFKMILLFVCLFALTQITAQTSNTININNIEWQTQSQSFNNVFKTSNEHKEKQVNLIGLQHAFKVVKQFNNVAIVKIINSSYNEAFNTQKAIKQANKEIKIEFTI